MIKSIENEFLIAEVNETGAELFSLKSKKTGIEYLWQANPEYWNGHAPVLFPICGRLFQGKYVYQGKEYEMPIHGIAKHAEFYSDKISDDEIIFTLKSDEDTKKQYPFDFEFQLKYKLNGNALETTYRVKNNGDKIMPFSFGAHPAFNVPFRSNERFEDYYIEFAKGVFDKILFSKNGLYAGATKKCYLSDNKLELKHNIFDEDIFFVTENNAVRLKSKVSDNFLEIAFNDMTCLGVWQVPQTDAPFVCIEPWHGIPADEGKVDDLSTKRQTIKLQPNKTYDNTYVIKISEN